MIASDALRYYQMVLLATVITRHTFLESPIKVNHLLPSIVFHSFRVNIIHLFCLNILVVGFLLRNLLSDIYEISLFFRTFEKNSNHMLVVISLFLASCLSIVCFIYVLAYPHLCRI